MVVWFDVASTQGSWHNGGGGSPVPVTMTTTTPYRPWGGLVVDPVHRGTLYANIQNPYSENGKAVFVTRSDDSGSHWTMIMTPMVSPPLGTFRVGTDQHEGTALVGYTDDPAVPSDRRYLSQDEGHTWRSTTCPGDLDGHCPAFIVDNVFGPGASYAFTARGIYRFHGAGPAETRLAMSDHLPVPWRAIIDIEAGRRYGDPAYLLAKSVRNGVQGVLYRTTDAGRSWRPLPLGMLPPATSQSHAPSALYLPRNGHHVAAVFVRMYHHLGPYILGLPVTEPYWEGNTLTQDFDHLRLEWRHGHIAVGSLGNEVYWPERLLNGPYPPISARSDTPTQRYFPQTRQLLQGDFYAFWKAHGGLAIFGAPISPVVHEQNDDGSGRTYAVQWFQNARLERHPEVHNRRFAILLGLLGRESLYVRGWLPPRYPDSDFYW